MTNELPWNFHGTVPLNHRPTVMAILNSGVSVQIFKFDHNAWNDYDLVQEIFSLGYKFKSFITLLPDLFGAMNGEMCCKYLDLFIEYGYLQPTDKQINLEILGYYLKYSFVENDVLEYMFSNLEINYGEQMLSKLNERSFGLCMRVFKFIKEFCKSVSDTEIFLGICNVLRNKQIKINGYLDTMEQLHLSVDSDICFEKGFLINQTFIDMDLFNFFCKVGIDFTANQRKCLEFILMYSIKLDIEIMAALGNMGFDFSIDDDYFIRYVCRSVGYYMSTIDWLEKNGYSENVAKYYVCEK
jgi:hypothetical protein